MSAVNAMGASPMVTVRQSRGTYDTATGTTPAPTDYVIQGLLDELTRKKDNAGTFFDVLPLILIYDDLPKINDSDGFIIDGKDWGINELKTDPTTSIYEIKLAR